MIQSYQEIWPSNPFVFHVPFQQYPEELKQKHGDRINLIKTPPDIKQTILCLIEDLAEEEWIYWCIDDKYLVEIDEKSANNCFDWVNKLEDAQDCGVMFCRCRKLLEDENLRSDKIRLSPNGDEYIERKNYYQFWIPQFLRVKVLRELFLEFPDTPFRAKEMDVFTGQMSNLIVKKFRQNQKMFVSKINYGRFGESTCGGRITQNCLESMIGRGISIADFKTSSTSKLIGKMKY